MRRNESGFTLVELLIAIVLLSLLAVAASLLLTTMLKINVQTKTGITDARSTELTIAYFNDDMRNATATVNKVTTPGATPTCVTAGSNTLVIEMSGNTFTTASAAPVPYVVSYVTRVTGGYTELHRLECTPTETTAAPDIELDTLSIAVQPTGAVPACATALSGMQTCAVTIYPIITSTPPKTPPDAGVPYTVTGTRRTS